MSNQLWTLREAIVAVNAASEALWKARLAFRLSIYGEVVGNQCDAVGHVVERLEGVLSEVEREGMCDWSGAPIGSEDRDGS